MIKRARTHRLCRTFIKLAARIVPADRRKRWRTEWEAELEHAWAALKQRPTSIARSRMRLVYRCSTCIRDALAVRRCSRQSVSASSMQTSGGRIAVVHDILQDLRMAVRYSRRTPTITFLALLTIALGIGTTTAVFSVVNGVLLNPLSHEDADQLVVLWETDLRYTPPAMRVNVSGANFADWRQQSHSFEGLAGYSIGTATLTGLAEPELVVRAWVTSNFLPLLRARPTLGRIFTRGEDTPGSNAVVVLSHSFWQRRYGGDPNVLGRTLILNSDSYEIVGVLDPGVDFLARGIQVWTPYKLAASDLADRGNHFLNVLARLRPRVTRQQAQAEMEAITDRIRLEDTEWTTNRGVNVLPLRDELVGKVRPTLLVLLGSVLVLLLISTVNVAGLLLVRAVGRRREIAVRSALGAGRGRLVRQALVESLSLAIVGGALGLAVAAAGTRTLLALAPNNIPRVSEVGLDPRVLAFALVCSVLTGCAVGMFPALQFSAVRISEALSEGGRWAAGGDRRRLRQALVVAEMALSTMLLISAGLLTQTFWRLASVDPGFASQSILTAKFRLPQSEYPDIAHTTAFYDQLLNHVRALPQVSSAGLTRFLPLSDGPWTFSLTVEGQPPQPEGEKRSYGYHPISPDYFRTAGITVLRGRDITEADNADAAPVVIINESMKQVFWPDGDPVGARIRFDQDPDNGTWREIVGVVRDVRHDALQSDPRPTVYGPYEQSYNFMLDRMRLVVRTASDPLQITQALRGVVSGLDPNLAVFDIRTMEQLVASSISQPRFSMLLVVCFACFSAVLALIGIYGVISQSVHQRLPELGLRIALGARVGTIGRLVLLQGLALAALGIGIGAAGALASTRLLESLLFGISASDPFTYLVLTLLLAAAAALASVVPARRAANTDPMVVMRSGG